MNIARRGLKVKVIGRQNVVGGTVTSSGGNTSHARSRVLRTKACIIQSKFPPRISVVHHDYLLVDTSAAADDDGDEV